MNWREVNFDGLVGPTHNYAGLSYGNLASARHLHQVSFPKRAAIQGVKKMRMVHDLGVEQAFLPPQLRPHIGLLRKCGFAGPQDEIVRDAFQSNRTLLAAASSSAFMWTANAGTVSPAPDTSDSRTHLTPANLISGLHRSIEPDATFKILNYLFAECEAKVHAALPPATALSDEGAANHMRLAPTHGQPGIEIFVFGRDAFDQSAKTPQSFPARQTLQASQAVAKQHLLDPDNVFYWQQKPSTIDAGAFHNDVVAVANENVLLCHAAAFENQAVVVEEMARHFEATCQESLVVIEVAEKDLTLTEAVDTYLFNSQLLTVPDGKMVLVAPAECHESPRVKKVIEEIVNSDNPIHSVVYPEVKQSMQNGGGPACLRLRVVLNDQQLEKLPQSFRFSDQLESRLLNWIEDHYREELSPDDLGDPSLLKESVTALTELEKILRLNPGMLANAETV